MLAEKWRRGKGRGEEKMSTIGNPRGTSSRWDG